MKNFKAEKAFFCNNESMNFKIDMIKYEINHTVYSEYAESESRNVVFGRFLKTECKNARVRS